MPIVTLHLLAGRSREQKKALAKALTDAVCANANVPPESVQVLLVELERDDWASAGKLFSDR